jgi:hypothetical protein
MGKTLQIDFNDEAWERVKQTRELLIKMFRSKYGAALSGSLIMSLGWFWKNRDKFEVYVVEDGIKKRFDE